MKVLYYGKLILLLILLCFSFTEKSESIDFYENAFKLEEITNAYDESGFLKNSHISVDGKLIVSNFNGNAMYSYPISQTSINGSKIDVSLTYSGNVPFTSFGFYDNLAKSWRSLHKNRPAWILGVNGFAVQAFAGANFFTNKPHINGLEFKECYGARTFCSTEDYEPYYSKDSHNDNDVSWVIEGYEFCNNMKSPIPDGNGYQDVIKILKSDGSILELRNVNLRPYNASEDTWDDEKYYTGVYYESSPDSKGIANVEFISNCDIEKPENGPISNFDNINFNKSPFWARIIHYYPGDGMEYVFREYIKPYGIEILYVHDPTGDNPLVNNSILHTFDDPGIEYEGKRLSFGYMSIGANWATPTIFYLEEIHNKYRKIADFTYSRHQSCEKQLEMGIQGNTRGRALLKNFLNHRISYSSEYVTIETPTRSFTLNMGERKLSGWDDPIPPPKDYFYPRFDEYNFATKNISSFDDPKNYYSWVDYITSIKEQDNTNTSNVLEKKIEFEYDTYTRVFDGECNSVCYSFPKVLSAYGSPMVDNKGADITSTDFRLSKIIEPDFKQEITYFAPNSNEIIFPVNDIGSMQDLGKLFNIVNIVNKKNNANLHLTSSVYDFWQLSRRVNVNHPDYPPSWDKCFANSILKVYDKLNSNKYTETQSWFETFMIEPPNKTGTNWERVTPYIFKTNLLKKVEIAEGITTTTWNRVANPEAMNDRDQNCTPKLIFLPTYDKQDIKFKDEYGTDIEIVKSCNEYLYSTSQKYNGNKIRDYSSYDTDYKVYDALGFEVLIQNRKVMNPLHINVGRELTYKVVNPQTLKVFVSQFIHLPKQIHQDLTINDEIFNYVKTKAEFNKKIYDIVDPEIKGKKLEDVLCLIESNDQININSKIFPPIFGILESLKIFEESNLTTNILTGLRKTIDDSPIFNGEINYKYGNVTEEYLIGMPGSSDIKTAEYDYSTGYKFGGLIKSVTNANSGQNFFYYDYSDAINGQYWNIPIDPTDNICTENTPSGIIRTNLENVSDNLNNIHYSRLNQGLYQYYTSQPYVNKQTITKYKNKGSSTTTVSIAKIFNYDPNGNVTASLDPNGWLTAFKYDIYNRNKQINLPYDFNDFQDVIGNVPSTEQLKITSSGVTNHKYMQQLFQCSTCVVQNSPEEIQRCNCISSGWDEINVIYDYNNLFAAVQSDYYPSLNPCLNPMLPRDNCLMLVNTYDIEQRIMPSWTGNLILEKPSDLSSISDLTSATFKIYISKIIGQNVILTIKFSNLNNYSVSYNFNVTSGVGDNTSDGFLNVDLSSKLSDIKTLLNSGNSLNVEFEVNTDGAKVEFANQSNDKIPSLILNGNFNWNNPNKYTLNNLTNYDYSVKHDFKFDVLESNRYQKLDDINHTFNSLNSGVQRREIDYKYTFGTDYKVNSSVRNSGSPDINEYFGNGLIKNSKDKLNQITNFSYDALGRNANITSPDASQTNFEYKIGRPLEEFGLINDEYFGFCNKVTSIDNKGIKTSKYYDAFDRLIKEVSDEGPGHLNKTITYKCDVLDRVTHVTNPMGQIIRYWYNNFGNIKYKYHPDMGITSYSYDKSGNIRFTQNEDQSLNNTIIYYEWDDQNRVIAFGEAKIITENQPVEFNPLQDMNNDDLFLNRLTDNLDPDILHTSPYTSIYTDNRTLWMDPIPQSYSYLLMNEVLSVTGFINWGFNEEIGNDASPESPIIRHITQNYETPLNNDIPENAFENLVSNSNSLRMVTYYDELPPKEGIAWGNMPLHIKWNELAPVIENGNRKLRNLKGRVSTIAYREHGGQPFNFMAFSYDERGRVEAVIRYTLNLGFDVVYYKYNSKNEVISVKTSDPTRVYNSWYGFDDDGRLQHIWSSLPQVPGLYGNADYSKDALHPDGWAPEEPSYNKMASVIKPANPDVKYVYTPRDQVADATYYLTPSLDFIRVNYRYNLERKWIEEIKALKNDDPLLNIFTTELFYDSDKLGLITGQNSQQQSRTPLHFTYDYDDIHQLRKWVLPEMNIQYENFDYDLLGCRIETRKKYTGNPNVLTSPYINHAGTNRLFQYTKNDLKNFGKTKHFYFEDGSLQFRTQTLNIRRSSNNDFWLKKDEKFKYDSKGLLEIYSHTIQTLKTAPGLEDPDVCFPPVSENDRIEWRYWYNPFGEREQKRMHFYNGYQNSLPWEYYLLGINKEQLVVYNGLQATSGSEPSMVSIFPNEFNV